MGGGILTCVIIYAITPAPCGDTSFITPSFIMNLAYQPEDVQTGTRRFVLEMLGFPAGEKTMLSSTFRLTGRRSYCYAEPGAPNERADIYLVNADNPEGLRLLHQRSPSAQAPAVLIGRGTDADGWPVIGKPIHWMRLFEQLDRQMQEALERRARREEDVQWDGRTFRRAADRAARPAPVFLEPDPVESVLVVDDSATVRAFMRSRLAPFRFDVDYAENGEMAIDMAQAKRYTCIFLDILMPGMDGYQVCKRIKSSPTTSGSAVVMLSSKSSAFDKFRGAWAGCDAYLGKPVGENELLATIARFLPSARKVAQSMLARTA